MNEITVQELQDFVNEHSVTFASEFGKGVNKKLVINMRGGFEVYNHNEKVWESIQPFSAVEKYNEL